MEKTLNLPLQTKTRLHGNPSQNPQFAVPMKSSKHGDVLAADPRAIRAFVALMDMYAVLGGAACHYGGPAALADLNSALYALVFKDAETQKKQWHELYHLINDAGHCENGLYALKALYQVAGLNLDSLKKFRSIESPLTGHGEVHCFPQGVLMSNGPLGSAFPQAQGLAAAEAMMVKAGQTARVTCVTVSDGAAMEGEAKEAFAAIPGLAAKGQMGPLVVVLSDNNTKLSGRIDQESFSMQPSFATLQGLGWNAIHLENAHDLNACGAALEKAIESARSNPKSPVVIIAKTIKGIGSKKTAESSSGGHGFPLKSPSELKAFLTEIYSGQNYPEMMNGWIDELMAIEAKIKAAGLTDSGEKIQNGVSKALIRAAREGMPVVSITSDLPGSTGVAGFRKEFPQLSIDVGVAESNMISMAAGMSKAGYIPVVDTFAQFGVTKGALPLTMASLSEAPVVAFFSHTGFQDAADGASHQALSYLAMTMAIPDLDVYVLSCSSEAEQLVYQAVSKMAEAKKLGKKSHSVVFFLGRENFPKSYLAGSDQPDVFDLNKYKIYTFGKDQAKAMILTHGSLMPEALKAAETLQAKISTKVVNLSNVKTFDVAKLGQDLNACGGNLIVVEDHQQVGGLSQYVSHRLNLAGVPFRLRSLAVQGRFGQSAYSALELYRMHGLDSEAIARAVQDLAK